MRMACADTSDDDPPSPPLTDVIILRSVSLQTSSDADLVDIAPQRKGDAVETSKKWAAGQNKQHVVTKNTAKLDRETEELSHQRVPLEVGKVIQQGRQNKGLTQKDLATKINEKPQIIAEYECGKAIPNNQVMGKIERAIGLKLRGKEIGMPLDSGPKKK